MGFKRENVRVGRKTGLRHEHKVTFDSLYPKKTANTDSQKNHSQITLVLDFLATYFIVGQMNYTHFGYLI